MSDSPLNNSWPSFSKLWMKRWSFKRASECKPCVEPCGSPGSHLAVQPYAPGGAGSSTSLPPASIAEDAFFSSTPEDEDTCSVVSDYDCPCAEVRGSVEDLPGLGPLADPRFFRGLQEAPKSPGQLGTPDPDLAAPALASSKYPAGDPHLAFMVTQLRPRAAPGYIIDGEEQEDPTGGPSLTIDLNGLLETLDARMGSEQEMQHADADLDAELDMDSFPILVRSMSTSRRHSWGVPLSPLNLGRRLSLDTAGLDSEGERDDDDEDVVQPTQRQQHPGDEANGACPSAARMAAGDSKRPYSEMLATDEGSRAALISRVVQTSKQAARATGAEVGPEEHLHSSEGQSHM